MTKFSVYAFNHSYAPYLTLISKDGCTYHMTQLLNLTVYQLTDLTYHLEQN